MNSSLHKCQAKYQAQRIPLFDLRREYSELASQLDAAYHSVMNSGWFILGNNVLALEEEFAKYVEAKQSLGVASGLDALILTMHAWGIKEGDEVIVQANGFPGTAQAVARLGAKPVLVDVDYKTLNFDFDKLAQSLTSRTKVIIPTHLYGNVCDLKQLQRLTENQDIYILEDASHAHGASYYKQKIGSISDATIFSAYPIKLFGAYGDAGLISSNNSELIKRIESLRNYGQSSKNIFTEIGFNSRLDELQAAFLRVKLAHLDQWIERRRQLVKLYKQALAKIPSIELIEEFNESNSAYYLFTIKIKNQKRNALQEYLLEKGIGTHVIYPQGIHLQPCFSYLGLGLGSMPITEKLSEEILSLPLSAHHTEEEIFDVIHHIEIFFGN